MMDTWAWFLMVVMTSTYFLLLCSHMAQAWIQFLDARDDPEKDETEAEDHAKVEILKDVMNADAKKGKPAPTHHLTS